MCKLLNVDDVAERLLLARGTVYKMFRNGEIPSVRIGGSIRVSEKMLEKWIEDQATIQKEAIR